MDQRLQTIADRWDKVEGRIKQVELLSRSVRIPAINELRYAGRQLVDALITLRNSAADPADIERKIQENFVVAEQYVRNADHDVSDATIDYIKNRIEDAARVHGTRNIVSQFEYYGEIKDRIKECEKLINSSRADRTIRDENYNAIFNIHLVRLLPLFDDFRQKEPEIIYRSLVLERKYRISKAFNLIAGLASIVGVGLAVLSWVVPWSEVKTLTCQTINRLCPPPDQKQGHMGTSATAAEAKPEAQPVPHTPLNGN